MCDIREEMREEEIRQFLTHLAVTQNVAAAAQNQAFAALLFLYRNVLHVELQNVNAVRAKKPRHLPVVFTPEEVRQILARLSASAFDGGESALRRGATRVPQWKLSNSV